MSKCMYKSMGLKECAETPGLYACSPCRESSAFERNETTTASAGPLGKLRDMSAEERARLIGTISDMLSQRSPLQEYIAKLERDILNSAAVPHFVLMGTPSSGAATAMDAARDERVYDFPCICGTMMRGTDRDRGRLCDVCRKPKPPTLREWLGDRVSGLGPWADVLREQPVPAGWIERWEWEHRPRDGSDWILWAYDTKGGRLGCRPDGFGRGLNTPDGPFGEALQMALFTRHPAVKPEPKPAAFPWDPYPEVL